MTCLERRWAVGLAVLDGVAKITWPCNKLLEEIVDALDRLSKRETGKSDN
jgi:hypothetical protein